MKLTKPYDPYGMKFNICLYTFTEVKPSYNINTPACHYAWLYNYYMDPLLCMYNAKQPYYTI